jgi:hypothetical protein
MRDKRKRVNGKMVPWIDTRWGKKAAAFTKAIGYAHAAMTCAVAHQRVRTISAIGGLPAKLVIAQTVLEGHRAMNKAMRKVSDDLAALDRRNHGHNTY